MPERLGTANIGVGTANTAARCYARFAVRVARVIDMHIHDVLGRRAVVNHMRPLNDAIRS